MARARSQVVLALMIVALVAFGDAQDIPEKKAECREDADCPPYHYCHYSYWIGQTCKTNNKVDDPETAIGCEGEAADGTKFPKHSICQQESANATDVPLEETAERCYKELNFTCAVSYFMPCNADYDDEGKIVEGQEEACPNKFACVAKEYTVDGKNETFRLCEPDEAVGGKSSSVSPNSPCKTSFDCGWSLLTNSWNRCSEELCRIPIE